MWQIVPDPFGLGERERDWGSAPRWLEHLSEVRGVMGRVAGHPSGTCYVFCIRQLLNIAPSPQN